MNTKRRPIAFKVYSKDDERRGLRRGVSVLPSLVTLSSLYFAYVGINWTIAGQFEKAAWAIFFSALFDSFDGLVARATGTESHFGQELDSLSDVLAFGLAPGLLMYHWALQPYGKLGFAAGFLYTAFTALRLARFNLQAATLEKRSFRGLPSPGAAVMIASTVVLYYHLDGQGDPSRHVILLVACYLLGLLMVSDIPYPSVKSLRLSQALSFRILALVVVAISFLVSAPDWGLFIVCLFYVLSGPTLLLLRLSRRSKTIENKAEQNNTQL